ncbi:hypothetical protein J4E83_001307 [Alternaria metachromatica]|uniref:uncharacterized protein n=1 Tax=Alternaria metachromatica TaxID=283354 RepID=UPI0020C499CD|nr:uncharacterized protein J4E83_001307 [Alternaria metachromatica]KAI4636353.1 hypothetical protein J4E83_001307 [Alternaria metachromatica]
MSYGYDANVVSLGAMAGQTSLEGNAKLLLEALVAERQDVARPLIFVTHSLGGLLCKQALLMAHNRPEYKSIFDAYAGIVFIGTPHKGSKQAKLGNLFVSFINIFRSANTEIVGMLKLQSKPLLMLDDDFWALMDGEKKNCAVHCYNESAPMSTTLGFIVDPVSAARPGGSSSPLHGNHSSMLKFATDQDNGYLTLSTKLKGWYNNLPSSTLVSTSNAPTQPPSPSKADARNVGSSTQADCASAPAAGRDAGAPRPRSNKAVSASSSNDKARDEKEGRGGFRDWQYLRTPKCEPTKPAIETMIVWLGSLRSKGRVIGDEACLCDGDDGIWRLDADKQSVQ